MPLIATMASWAASWANLLSAEVNGSPVLRAMCSATKSANSGCEFSPVPTAVPPRASSWRSSSENSMRRMSASSWATYPLNSCDRVSGTASIRWVRPIFTMPSNSATLAAKDERRWLTAGSSRWLTSSAAEMCIAVGKVSLLLWPRLTWSFGCTGCLLPSSPPAISMARLAITSLQFMFVCVPEPVCQMRSGKCESSSPEITSSQAAPISSPSFPSSSSSSTFVAAAACLSTPKARMTGRGIRSSPMSKLSSERAVCAPQ